MITQEQIEARADWYESLAKTSRSKAEPKPREHYLEKAKADLEEEAARRAAPKPEWLQKIQKGHEPRRAHYRGQRGCFAGLAT